MKKILLNKKSQSGQAIIEFCLFVLFFFMFIFTMEYFHLITQIGERRHMEARIKALKEMDKNQIAMRTNSGNFKENIKVEAKSKSPIEYKSLYMNTSELESYKRKIDIEYNVSFGKTNLGESFSDEFGSGATYESATNEGMSDAGKIEELLKAENDRRKKLKQDRPIWQ